MGHVVSKSSRVSPSNQKNEQRRIILIGKTGTGKSTLGNAILNSDVFSKEGVQMETNTMCCKVGKATIMNGKDVVVVDTPGLKSTKLEPKKVFEELCTCNAKTAPGPHIFCFTIRGDERFTRENIDTLRELCSFFGEEICKYMIVVFTHKAEMGKTTTVDDCFSVLPNDFREKFLKFGDNKIAIECNCKKRELTKQINELFTMIENIIKRNNGGYYSEDKFKAAEEAFKKKIEEAESLNAKMKAEVIKQAGNGYDIVAGVIGGAVQYIKSWFK